MTKISKTMLQLAQAHKKIASTQQQNHQTMVNVQQQQATAFEALAAATQQQKYDAMFAAVPRYDDYYVDLETSSSFSKHFNDICVFTLGQMTGTTFPVTINSQVNINALYDTEATRSCMNYDTFFNLGLDLDDKPAPHVRTASGTDMGAIGFAMLNLLSIITFLPNSSLFAGAR